MSFTFSASRLDGSAAKDKVSAPGGPQQAPSVELTRTPFYTISKKRTHTPQLNPEERPLKAAVYGNSITTLITSERVLIYDFSSVEKHPYSLEFPYEKSPENENVLPLVRLIPGPVEGAPPDLIIADCLSGRVRYFESLQLTPSLDVLQNEHRIDLSLSKGEALVEAAYSDDVGLILATSDRRVVSVVLRDQLGRVNLSTEEVLPSRASFSFLRRGAFSAASYEMQPNKIVALRLTRVSPLLTTLLVQEDSGLLTQVNFVSGSGHTVTVEKNIIDLFMSVTREPEQLQDFRITDVRPLPIVEGSQQQNSLVLAVFGGHHAYSLVLFNIAVVADKLVSLDSKYLVRSTKTSDPAPSLSLLKRDAIILAGNSLVFANTANFTENSWEDSVTFKEQITTLGKSESSLGLPDLPFQIMTSDGAVSVEILSEGTRESGLQFVQSHINQYLEFGSQNSPVEFQVDQATTVSAEDAGDAIISVVDEILSNRSRLASTYTSPSSNLKRRSSLMEKLSKYISQNFGFVSNNVRMYVANACELCGLGSELCQYPHVSDPLSSVVKQEYSCSTAEFFTKHTNDVVALLQAFTCTFMSDAVGNEQKLVDLGTLLNTVLTEGYLASERNIKSALLDVHYESTVSNHPIFLDHFQFLSEVNGIVRALSTGYAEELDSSEDSSVKNAVAKAILGLALFLYYTLNDLLQYTDTQGTGAAETKAQLEQFYRANRENWIKIFIYLHKQDEMVKLVDGFDDLDSLSELLDSERAYVESPSLQETIDPIELKNMASDVEQQFDSNFEKHGYEFARSLFSYYVRTQKVDILLTRFTKYSEFLGHFLDSDVSYAKVSWILDVENDKFSDASGRLLKYVRSSASEKESVNNKELELNIAKLSMIADGTSSGVEAGEIQSSLGVIGCQIQYQHLLEDKYGAINELAVSTLVSGSRYLSDNGFTYFPGRVANLLKKAEKKVQLDLFELVDLLTLPDLTGLDRDAYDDLFKVLSELYHSLQSSAQSGLLSEPQYPQELVRILLALTFKRLILTDDWEALKKGDKSLKESHLLVVLSNMAQYQLTPPTQVTELYLSKADLEYLQAPPESHKDYLSENDSLSKLNESMDLNKWLSAM